MTLRISDRSLTALAVVVLIVVLPVLAVLQYRWLSRVSDRELERAVSTLTRSANGFSREFDRELARAYLNLALDAKHLRDQRWDQYADRYDKWYQSAPHPKIVSMLLLIQKDTIGRTRLARFNPNAKHFDQIEWNRNLEKVRQLFEQESTYAGETPRGRWGVGSIAGEVPALIIPIVDFSVQDRGSVVSLPLGYIVLVLDLDYIARELIPELAKRHSLDNQDCDCHLRITNRENPVQVVYQTTDAPGTANATAPIATELFTLRLDDLSMESLNIDRSGKGQLPRDSGQVKVSVLTNQPEPREPNEGPTVRSGWTMLVMLEGGTLEATIASVRRRNLLISIGVLLILAFGVVLLLVTTRRARSLAKLQLEFVAAVSHELRTPVAAIYAAGENLADGVITDEKQVKQYGSMIKNEGRRLTQTVNQVLDFAETEAGQNKYEFHPLDIREVISVAIDDALTENPTLEIQADLEMDLPRVFGEASSLRRVLQNLIRNAVKYGASSCVVRSHAVAMGGLKSEVRVSIADNGVGIHPDDLPQIFEPFFRGGQAVASQVQGYGLGLSIVKRIVRAHGGQVYVTSVLGRGTTFTLHFPGHE